MSVKMYPTPSLHTGGKKFVQFQVTRQDQLGKPANALASEGEPKPRVRSKANRKKNPTRAEKEADRAKLDKLMKRIRKTPVTP